jgi:transcription elongation factor Elf1
MIEHYFQCPHCWEEISMLLDSSVSQTYIEDCEVCCNPIEITVKFEAEKLIQFRTEILGQ